MIEKIILSTLISLSPSEKRALNNLQNKLENKGYDISEYFENPKFEIYKFETKNKFVNYSDTTKSWYMRKDSLEKCADFIEKQYYWLKKAEKEFGVSPEHITSQLQLETNLGQYTGNYPVINALISRYLRRPDLRGQYYVYLTDFLDLVSDTTDNIILPKEIFEIKGSWAGAYGIAQMMPNVLKKYGRDSDFNGDGFFDSMNIQDAIGFIARYLSENGFKENSHKAIQRYNSGHPFYGTSIGKHTKELEKIIKKRRSIPPEKLMPLKEMPKFSRKIKTSLLDAKPIPKYEVPKKQIFIKRIFSRKN